MSNLQRIHQSSLLRYVLIGGTAFLIDIGLLNLGIRFGLSVVQANLVSTSIAFLYSFFFHRRFTFSVRAQRSSYHLPHHWQFIVFIALNICSIIFGTFILHIFVSRLAVQVNPAKILTNAFLFLINYTTSHFITFRIRSS